MRGKGEMEVDRRTEGEDGGSGGGDEGWGENKRDGGGCWQFRDMCGKMEVEKKVGYKERKKKIGGGGEGEGARGVIGKAEILDP